MTITKLNVWSSKIRKIFQTLAGKNTFSILKMKVIRDNFVFFRYKLYEDVEGLYRVGTPGTLVPVCIHSRNNLLLLFSRFYNEEDGVINFGYINFQTDF